MPVPLGSGERQSIFIWSLPTDHPSMGGPPGAWAPTGIARGVIQGIKTTPPQHGPQGCLPCQRNISFFKNRPVTSQPWPHLSMYWKKGNPTFSWPSFKLHFIICTKALRTLPCIVHTKLQVTILKNYTAAKKKNTPVPWSDKQSFCTKICC